MSRKTAGFTLIELLVAVVLLSVLTTLAIPSFRGMIARNRVTSQANQLLQMVTFARSEAIRLNRSVTLRTSSTTNNWAEGISLFLDRNSNGTLDSGTEDTNGDGLLSSGEDTNGDGVLDLPDAELRNQTPFAKGVKITGSANVAVRLTFSPQGLSNTNGNWEIEPLIPNGALLKKKLIIGPTGRPRVE